MFSSNSNNGIDKGIPLAPYHCVDLDDAEKVSIDEACDENSTEKSLNIKEQSVVDKRKDLIDESSKIGDEDDSMIFTQKIESDDSPSEIIAQVIDEIINCVVIKTGLNDELKEDEGVHVIKFMYDSSKEDVNGTVVRGSNPHEKPRKRYVKSPEVKLNRAYHQLRAKDIKKKFVPSGMGL